MLKKWMALTLCVCMLLSAATAWAETQLDFSYVLEHTELFSIDPYDDGSGDAQINSLLGPKEEAFLHEKESNYNYSFFDSNIYVADYESGGALAALRTWIIYCADEYLNITSVTFTLGGNDYTFSGIGSRDRLTKLENGVKEQLLLIYGNSADWTRFTDAMLEWASPVLDGKTVADLPIVFHGTQNVKATLGNAVANEWIQMMLAYAMIGGSAEAADSSATKLKVTQHVD